MLYFFAPLIAIKEVIRLKDASSIYPPSIFTNALNCTMWMCYGFIAVEDPVVWGPNVLGMVLQIINTLLIIKYPRLLSKAPNSVPVPALVPTTDAITLAPQTESELGVLRGATSDDLESAMHGNRRSGGDSDHDASSRLVADSGSDATLRRRAVSDHEKDVNTLTARL